MRISLIDPSGNISTIDLPDEGNDKELIFSIISAEAAISTNELQIVHYGKSITLRNINELNLQNEDVVYVSRITQSQRKINLSDIPPNITHTDLMNLVKEHPHLLTQIQNSDPEMGNALASSNVTEVRMIMMKRLMANHKLIFEQKQEENKIWADPDNIENQKKIEERIRKENITASMETAIEQIPESFGRVIMLYVSVEVNGHPIKAFVDSGAQSTIMSLKCAQKCNIDRLIDIRFAGEARGVGTAKILGRVHMAQMKINNTFFPISLTILESSDVDFLFGLDMLKRHRCSIDLAHNVLRVENGNNNYEELQFLGEADIPKSSLFSDDADHSSPTKMDVDDKIQHLISLGFSQGEAVAALDQANGDVELAANLLYATRT